MKLFRFDSFLIAVIAFYSLISLSGCGTDNKGIESAILEVNQTIADTNSTIVVDNNITINDDEIINVDVNNTIVINPLDTSYFGNGTYLEPYRLMEANYVVNGDTWYYFRTPTLNSNCTITTKTSVLITNIFADTKEFEPIEIVHISNNVFSFDVNDTQWATLSFYCVYDGFITTIGDCLQRPELYNLGE